MTTLNPDTLQRGDYLIRRVNAAGDEPRYRATLFGEGMAGSDLAGYGSSPTGALQSLHILSWTAHADYQRVRAAEAKQARIDAWHKAHGHPPTRWQRMLI